MPRKECIAMILAGGKGERLGALTDHAAKPIVYYGGAYRIIDFSLSNCAHSGIDTLGVLTQYRAQQLDDYVGDGRDWDFARSCGGVYMLPASRCGGPYTGTANAVLQNIDFIDQFQPEHILILSGDHIYQMDYRKMLDFHKEKGAAVTISVVDVPYEEASRFGIMSANRDGKITEFAEKPRFPKSTLASMGIYIFQWNSLKEYLLADQYDEESTHDFGKNIIPAALAARQPMYAYRFEGYWRDVGTVHSLWESNMDLLGDAPPIALYDHRWRILTRSRHHAPCSLSGRAEVMESIVAGGCRVFGKLKNSVVCNSAIVEEGAEVVESILMPGAVIGKGARIVKTIVGDGAYVGENVEIGTEEGVHAYVDDKICSKGISVIGPGICIEGGTRITRNSHVQFCTKNSCAGFGHAVYPVEALSLEHVYAS